MGRKRKTTDKKLDELKKKLEQTKTRLAALERAAAVKARKEDTRKKILIGGTVLARVSRGELSNDELTVWLDGFLTRDYDRRLFGLPPKERRETESPAE